MVVVGGCMWRWVVVMMASTTRGWREEGGGRREPSEKGFGTGLDAALSLCIAPEPRDGIGPLERLQEPRLPRVAAQLLDHERPCL